jgi:hypothetical protein
MLTTGSVPATPKSTPWVALDDIAAELGVDVEALAASLPPMMPDATGHDWRGRPAVVEGVARKLVADHRAAVEAVS